MKKIINEMDLLFKHVVKYYNMRDKKNVKKEWNSLVGEVENLNLDFVMPRLSTQSEESKKFKSLFVTYFDGCYGVDAEPNTASTYVMGVCNLEYKDEENELVIHLRRPGLLIGKGGRTIEALAKHLGCKIGVVEVSLRK